MKKKEHLFFLIKSLTKAEKRYFRLFASSNNENKNYLLLFNAIDKQEKYDEALIKKNYAGRKFSKQLHVTKNYLTQLILKSLRNFHSTVSADAKLKDLQREIEILQKRELYVHCETLLDKAIKLAGSYEKWPDLLSLLDTKRRILLNSKGSIQSFAALKEIHKKEKETISKISNTSTYWDLTTNLFSINQTREKTMENPYLKTAENADSIQARTLYHFIWQGIYFTQNDYNNASEHMNQAINLWEENKHQISENPGSYLTLLNNLIGINLNFKKFEEAEKLVHKIRQVPGQYKLSNNNPIAIKAVMQSYNVELEIYRDTNQIKKGISVISEADSYMKAKPEFIPKTYKLLLLYQFAYLYYLNNQLDDSLAYLNIILAGKFENIREDIQSFAHLLFLIIHFELNNMILLRYAVESCRRFLKKKHHLQGYERVLLTGFSKLSTVSKNDYKKYFTWMKQNIFKFSR